MFNWLEQFANWLIFSVLEITANSKFGVALNFFVYDTIKILILLFSIVFLMGIVNAYLPIEKLKDTLARRKLYGLEHVFASLFGAITPFCSCSSVPLFIGFVQGGIPLGVTFSFLITSPLVNEIALAMFIGMFGVKTTVIYVLSGIVLGTVGGWVLGKLNLEPLLSDWVKKIIAHKNTASSEMQSTSLREKLPHIFSEARVIVKSVLVYIVVGIGIGAAMHGYVPNSFFEKYLGGNQWWTVPLAVVVGVPLYANAAAILPLLQVLVTKGVPVGTAIAFMMSTVGLSIPEATLLKKVMTLKLIVIYFGVVTLFIIISGFIFNLIL